MNRSDAQPRRTVGNSVVLALLLGVAWAPAVHGFGCGSLENAYGPFDYTNPRHFRELLPVVEANHFDEGVENLVGIRRHPGGKARLGGDIDYTLRAFPNHHRALMSMIRYHTDALARTRPPMQYTPDCYFERALRFKPNDGVVYLLKGLYLTRVGRDADAVQAMQQAAKVDAGNPEVHYNLGLLLVKNGQAAAALEHAHIAYSRGYPLPGLRRQLEDAGVWTDPPPPAESPPTASQPAESQPAAPESPAPEPAAPDASKDGLAETELVAPG